MMIDPPIDALARKTGNNKYILANLISKRAKEIETLIRVQDGENNKKAISIACEEVFKGKIAADKLDI